MAAPSRLYLPPSGGTPGITPTPHAEWTENLAGFTRVVPVLTPNGVASSTPLFSIGSGKANADLIARQFIFPLVVGTVFATTQTLKGQIRCAQFATSDNLRSQVIVRVMASDGTTVRATLYGGDLTTQTTNPTSEWVVSTNTNRRFPRGGALNLQANYTSVAGDHLVIEIGWRTHDTAASDGQIVFRTDAGSDLPEDETTTTSLNPWIEFSGDLDPPTSVDATVTHTAGNLALGNSANTVRASVGIAHTKSDLALNAVAGATVRANIGVAATRGNLNLDNRSHTVGAGATLGHTHGNLDLNNRAHAAGVAFSVGHTKGDLALNTMPANPVRVGYTIPHTRGDLALNAHAHVITPTIAVAALVSNLLLGGSSGALSVGAGIAATPGNLALAAAVASIAAGVTVGAGAAGNLSLNAHNHGIAIALGVAATAGALALDAQAHGVSAGATVGATASNLALGGSSGGVSAGVTISGTRGDLALNAHAHVITPTTGVIALTSTLTLDGVTHVARASATVVATAGDLDLEGTLAEIVDNTVIVGATVANLALNGTAGAVSAGAAVQLTPGDLALAGNTHQIPTGLVDALRSAMLLNPLVSGFRQGEFG